MYYSYFSTGIKNIVDKAVILYAKKNKIDNIKDKYEKIDEIPFDYNRKKTSIVVKSVNGYKMITKGALEEVIKSCNKALIGNKKEKITDKIIDVVNKKAKELEDRIKFRGKERVKEDFYKVFDILKSILIKSNKKFNIKEC